MKEVTEYQKSAALLAHDIELLYECAVNNPELAMDFFKKLKEMRDDVIGNEESRNSRYSAMSSIFCAASAGLVKSTKMDDV